ncbi:MAG: glycosyltransferase family 2 protein [Chloroflexi bacterium]|nr:glycosyltransferase family 2 protein [Chloroflexota bacterium]
MDVSIVIPCRDEAENVPLLKRELHPVVAELRRTLEVEIVLVDDGSTDGTGDLLESAFLDDTQVRVVRHERGMGPGAAIRTGFAHSTGAIAVTTDCDASYPFALIPNLIGLMSHGVDIVTASCYHPLGGVENVPAYRIFLSRAASHIYQTLLDRRIHTYTCLFRAYRREVIECVEFQADGFLGVTELLANAILAGFTVRELPCVLRARRYGASKARVARIIASHLMFQWGLLSDGRLRRGRSVRRGNTLRHAATGSHRSR